MIALATTTTAAQPDMHPLAHLGADFLINPANIQSLIQQPNSVLVYPIKTFSIEFNRIRDGIITPVELYVDGFFAIEPTPSGASIIFSKAIIPGCHLSHNPSPADTAYTAHRFYITPGSRNFVVKLSNHWIDWNFAGPEMLLTEQWILADKNL